jgi:hypothetical protein
LEFLNLINTWCPGCKLFVLLTAVFSIGYCCSQAEGAEFSLKPSITLREEYDDNIFLTKDNRVDDYITRILPSLSIDHKTPSWDLSTAYTLDWRYYFRQKEGRDSHTLDLTSQVRVIKNFLYLDIADTYASVVLNPRRPSTNTNLTVNRTDSNNATISPYIKYQISPVMSLSTGYRYLNVWYRDKQGINRQMHTGFATVGYTVNPKLNTFLSADYTWDRPDSNTSVDVNNNQTSISFGATYTLSPQTNVSGTIGYRWITFSDGFKKHMPFYSAALSHHFSGTGLIELRGSSTITADPQFGVFESKTGQLTVKYGQLFIVNGSIFYSRNKYLETDRKDDTFGLTAGIEYKPKPRLTYRASGRYENDKFFPEDTKREIYNAYGEIAYLLTSKATLSFSYTYTRSISQITIDDYWDNVAAVQVTITF